MKKYSQIELSYLAGFLDGNGSIYVRLKPNQTYKYNFQISPSVAFFQSKKDEKNFAKICELVGYGSTRVRKDGIVEHVIGKQEEIKRFLLAVEPFLVLKKKQANLMLEILRKKQQVQNRTDFVCIMELIEKFRELNYSKKKSK